MPHEHQREYRRSTCDELLAASAANDLNSEYHGSEETGGLLGRDIGDEPEQAAPQRPTHHNPFFVRALALLCACSLSVGSHYASYILGPLKSRLIREMGTSHTEFSLLISAFSLNSTWTPLVGGLLASRLGTTLTSILATGVILLGQILLLIGDIWGNIRLMALGLFVFGLGVSPLAVVQETIIVRFFKTRGLGVSMAFGLIAGKGASFLSARTTYPLTERFGPRAPFYVATFLAAMSVVVNIVYIAASKWLVDGAGAELEASDITEEARLRSTVNLSEAQALQKVAAKRIVHIHQVTKLGDVFWAYVGLNVFCGAIWAPFNHLAANIIEQRYGLTEEAAARQASYLLAWSLVLYPICGFVVDRYKHRPIVVELLVLSSCLTLSAYTWFALPPSWTHTALPAIGSFGFGVGFSPLLLVVLVPKIVASKYVSTALGVHKSLEQTGSVLVQTLAGLALDTKGNEAGNTAIQYLLDAFILLNVLQLLSVVSLGYLQQRKTRISRVTRRHVHGQSSEHHSDDAGLYRTSSQPLLSEARAHYSSDHPSQARQESNGETKSKREVRRAEIFAILSFVLILFAWVLFMGTAWLRLGGEKLV